MESDEEMGDWDAASPQEETAVSGDVPSSPDSLSSASDSDISVYSNEPDAMAEIRVEMPFYFVVGGAMALDSIDCLNRLADFVPIPVDWSDYPMTEAASVAEVTMAGGSKPVGGGGGAAIPGQSAYFGVISPSSPPPWIDDCIRRLEGIVANPDLGVPHLMPLNEVVAILHNIIPLIMEEGSLVECEAPCKVVGDLHGQFVHMHMLFDLVGRVPKEKMMFLGNYIDRGPHSTEVPSGSVSLLPQDPLAFSHFPPPRQPRNARSEQDHCFYAELINKFGYPGIGLWYDFMAVFNRLPMAGLIGKKILCIHGGLSPELVSLDTIRDIVRPCEPLDRGLLCDLLWSDPTNKVSSPLPFPPSLLPPGRGLIPLDPRNLHMFGKAVTAQFCERLGIDLIIRAHQVVNLGYEFMSGRKLITVFSAPNYCNQFSNAAAVVVIDGELEFSFKELNLPTPKGAKRTPIIAVSPERVSALGCPNHPVTRLPPGPRRSPSSPTRGVAPLKTLAAMAVGKDTKIEYDLVKAVASRL